MTAQPIAPHPTAITAFIGASPRGPRATPTRCARWGDFVTTFGDFAHSPRLAHAVHGFFLNGGDQCVVVNAPIEAALPEALATLQDAPGVTLVAAPGWSAPESHEALLGHCEAAGSQLAILDPPRELPGTGVDSLVRPRASQSGALYFPWLRVHDPGTGEEVAQPPSGHVAGIFARVARERGVHYAPADAVVRGAVGLTWEVTQGEHDILHPRRINVIRTFTKRGVRIWGANTLAEVGFRLIASKRLLDHVALSVQEGTRWVAEAPRGDATMKEVRAQVAAFLEGLWRDGVLPGGDGVGYTVRCDAGMQTPEVEAAGALVFEFGVSLGRPGRFVGMRVVHGG